VIGMEVRDVDMSEMLAHGDDFGDHPVRIAEKLGGIDQDRVPLPEYEGRVAVETQVTVKKDSESKRQIPSSFPIV
jgi:hypothetical protein